jgi:predicted transcriptional regulator
MRRTQIQLDEETHDRLREEAHARRTSMAEVIRGALREHLGLEPRPRDETCFSFVASGRSDQKDLAPVSERHDEALARATHRRA